MAKKIMLLATGGTIACTPGKHGLEPTLRAQDLVALIQESLPCELVARDVFLMDSSNMQPEEWCALAQAIDKALGECDGVVVTHGTDTMAYTAAVLSFMLAGAGKPIILTGSQLPLLHPLSDARLNLLRAVTAALEGVAGVYVSFAEKLISGVRCVKTHTTSLSAFSSVNAPLAGHYDAEGVHFTCPQPYFPLHAQEPYRLRAIINPHVFMLKLVPGTSPDVLRFVHKAGYKGLVIEAFGLGGLHYIRRNLVKGLEELSQEGIRMMVVSQCLYEKADLSIYEVGHGLVQDSILSGRDMTTEAAVCKMMWALAQENPDKWLNHCMVGEYR
ncbi:MAG: asparaginase [Clostridia bacterium]